MADWGPLPYLLHGKETRVCGDQAYRGHTDVIGNVASRVKDVTS